MNGKIWYAEVQGVNHVYGRSWIMEVKRVWAVWFSATDTTKKTVTAIADRAAEVLGSTEPG